MGWSNCGTDSNGRPIGYAHAATCDHEGCNKVIDRGLSYACGNWHGITEYGCEKYFCNEHRKNWVLDNSDNRIVSVCDECAKALLDSGDMVMDEEEGVIVHAPTDSCGHQCDAEAK
ncbi:hypothetical protein [Plesiomonas shigelloides]|uniref:hypothetical protein n=1 Tax=Plesiomonas shigelloides TaxID=703 RepID=UPI00387F344D